MSIRVGFRRMARNIKVIRVRKILASIFSTYSLCSSVPFEELTSQPTSAYVLCIEQKRFLTASPASVHSLSTAPT